MIFPLNGTRSQRCCNRVHRRQTLAPQCLVIICRERSPHRALRCRKCRTIRCIRRVPRQRRGRRHMPMGSAIGKPGKTGIIICPRAITRGARSTGQACAAPTRRPAPVKSRCSMPLGSAVVTLPRPCWTPVTTGAIPSLITEPVGTASDTSTVRYRTPSAGDFQGVFFHHPCVLWRTHKLQASPPVLTERFRKACFTLPFKRRSDGQR